MGMKIWAIEKLQRMLTAIHEPDTSAAYAGGRAGSVSAKGRGETELSQVLRNERLHGPADRDPSQLMKDLVFFRGPFIYVHDMDEKVKPIMIREYAKVARRQDGVDISSGSIIREFWRLRSKRTVFGHNFAVLL